MTPAPYPLAAALLAMAPAFAYRLRALGVTCRPSYLCRVVSAERAAGRWLRLPFTRPLLEIGDGPNGYNPPADAVQAGVMQI